MKKTIKEIVNNISGFELFSWMLIAYYTMQLMFYNEYTIMFETYINEKATNEFITQKILSFGKEYKNDVTRFIIISLVPLWKNIIIFIVKHDIKNNNDISRGVENDN